MKRMLVWTIALMTTSAFAADLQLPDGWKVIQSGEVPAGQRDAIGQKLGGKINALNNTTIQAGEQAFKFNTVTAASKSDADGIENWFRANKGDARFFSRQGDKIYELVGNDIHILLKARYALGVQPKKVTYKVSFDAAPIKTCDYMSWNRMYNLFLQPQLDEAAISDLAKNFEFGGTIKLRGNGLKAQAEQQQKAGITFLPIEGTIVSQTGALTPDSPDREALIAGNDRWPVDDPEIQKLAKSICGNAADDRAKVEALLKWFHPKNGEINFAGDITGSRYGVAKVMEQRYGHCWDFSDLFITLARANGIPCRQIFGWIHGISGHVWAEVFLEEQQGWLQVDPTTTLPCGSDYIPFAYSDDGEHSMVYVSPVKIEVVAP